MTAPVLDAGAPPSGEGWLEVALADYPTLAEPGGAAVIEAPLVDVWVLHRADGSFISVWRVCTHGACDVAPVAGEVFECPCHGSRFGPDGAVLVGPATRPLARFDVVRAGASLYLRRG